MAASAARWRDLYPWLANEDRFGRVRWGILLIAGLVGAFAPLAGGIVLVAAAVMALLWRFPVLVPLLLIAVMGNTKFNIYLGFVTVFPEYIVLAMAAVIQLLQWIRTPEVLEDTGFLGLFALLTFSGLVSFVFALEISPVLARALIIPIAGAVFWVTLTRLRDRRQILLALVVMIWSVAAGAAFGVAQMIAITIFRRNIDLGFLRTFGNPEFEYSVGPPVLHQLTSTFRANGLFNDPNILGGFLATMLPILAALALGPWTRRSRGWLVGVWSTLAMSAIALLLTLSRSGILAAVVGLVVLLMLRPAWLRAGRLWAGLGVLAAAAVTGAAFAGVQVVLILARLLGSFASHDVSARTHEIAFRFAWELFGRFPITGVGLRNFGPHYVREVEPMARTMMAHNAFLGWLAETGMVGGLAMTALLIAVVRPVVRAARDRSLELRDPEMHALLAGLVAAFAALAVTNFFYDFWLRTFVWVVFGFAVAVARLVSRPEPHS